MEDNDEWYPFLQTQGYAFLKKVPGYGICGLHKYMFTTGLVTHLTPSGYMGRYCFERTDEAFSSLEAWDGKGDPAGNWIKYKGFDGERLGPGATHDRS